MGGGETLTGCWALCQDGYAVVSADGPGDYDVAFEALAGTAAGSLKAGTVAYITTGAVHAYLCAAFMVSMYPLAAGQMPNTPEESVRNKQVHLCQREPTQWCR